MRVAQAAPPCQLIPRAGYGGTERVVSPVTEALLAVDSRLTDGAEDWGLF